jgi:maleylpyruvate isomerase
MYRDGVHRAAEIESGASLPAAQLRALVRDSAAALAADFDTLRQAAMTREVTTCPR